MLFRHIIPGFERIDEGFARPRHAHLSGYASVIVGGGYEQTGYFGRVRLEPGDVLIQPVLDRHESWGTRAGCQVLRLPWHPDAGLGGLFRPPDIELVIRVAERDPHEAAELLEEKIARLSPVPVAMHDWPDLLASDIRNYQVGIADWADAKGLARETVSRGFARVWGTSPSVFRQELRARAAWIDIVTTDDDLAGIAVEHGFFDQPHMTRAIRALTGAPPAAWRRRVRAREVRLQL